MSQRRKQRKGLIIRATFSLLLTVIGVWCVLEFGLRHFYQLIPLRVCASDGIVGSYYCQPYFEYDKPIRLGYTYTPNFRLEGMWDPADPYLSGNGEEVRPSTRSDAFQYEFQVDAHGFPNGDAEWQDEYDIVIAGDSFTIPSAPERWIDILSEQSEQTILTLGAPSWTTLNEVEAVKQFGLDKRPEWVIIAYFDGNDLLNVRQYQEKSASDMDWREYDMAQVKWYERLLTYHFIKSAREERPETTTPTDYRYPIGVNTEQGVVETVLKDIHLIPLSAAESDIEQSAEFAAIKTSLLELKQLTDAQDTRLMLLYIPSKEHVVWSRVWDETDVNNILARTVTTSVSSVDGENGRLEWEQTYLSYDQFSANHGAQQRVLEAFTQENGIDFLNLTPHLWEQTIAQGEMYHYGDSHWNQAGNQLAADIIEAYLERVGLTHCDSKPCEGLP